MLILVLLNFKAIDLKLNIFISSAININISFINVKAIKLKLNIFISFAVNVNNSFIKR